MNIKEPTADFLLGFSDTHRKSIRYASKFIGVEDLKTLTQARAVELLLEKKDNYKNTTIVQVARIIKSTDRKKFRSILSKIIPLVGWKRTRSISIYKKMDKVTYDAIEQLVLDVFSNPYMYSIIAPAIIMCMCTNLRLGELKQLTRAHIENILGEERINIKIKKRSRFMRILCIKPILEKYKAYFTHITSNKDDLVLKSSSSEVNKTIRTELLKRGATLGKFGIQCIRTYNTTRLIANLPLSEVARFNRHRNQNTTAQFYNTGNVVFEREFKEFL